MGRRDWAVARFIIHSDLQASPHRQGAGKGRSELVHSFIHKGNKHSMWTEMHRFRVRGGLVVLSEGVGWLCDDGLSGD